jgi:hypothetical protein
MTWCETQVAQFNASIKLDDKRKERIEGAVKRFQEFCTSDNELKLVSAGKVFLQGSVATATVIKPLDSDEFDVDVVYPFNLDAFDPGVTPKQIIDWFLSRLRESDFYKNRLIPRDRCARIDYAGDFHVDIIPATTSISNKQPYAIPAADLGDWIVSDPWGYVEWVGQIDEAATGVDASGDGRFVRCCRMMKRWRDEFFSVTAAPTSILLVTMLGKHDPSKKTYNPALTKPLYPQYQTDMAYLYDMLRLTHSCLQIGRRSAFTHPTVVPDEDLSRGWDEQNLVEFMARLRSCYENVGHGIFARDEKESLKHYAAALGKTFPAS